jgi:Tfp pilus assembly protein FimT
LDGVARGLKAHRRLFRQRLQPLHGFTLVELLVVVAVLIRAVLWPS